MITYVPLQNVKMQLQRCLLPILVCAPFCLSLGFKMMSASKRGLICNQMDIKVMFEASFFKNACSFLYQSEIVSKRKSKAHSCQNEN